MMRLSRRLADWARWTALALLTGGAAQASCQFGAPVVNAVDSYRYAQDWTQTVQLPVSCTGGSTVSSVRLSSTGGTLEASTGRFLGTMRFGASALNYVIPGAAQLRVISSLLTFQVTVPAGQWGAPTGPYSDSLTVSVDF
ncbi:hypothetical protein [Deinococcus betulae]|uniref:hypothetical protein n=1 Tax=Deinococcus betulae TaxID=2873312 RepID=UPI003F717905